MRDLGANDLIAEARHTEASIMVMEEDVIDELNGCNFQVQQRSQSSLRPEFSINIWETQSLIQPTFLGYVFPSFSRC